MKPASDWKPKCESWDANERGAFFEHSGNALRAMAITGRTGARHMFQCGGRLPLAAGVYGRLSA